MSEPRERRSKLSVVDEIEHDPGHCGRTMRGAKGGARLDMLTAEEQQRVREYSRTASLRGCIRWLKAEMGVDICARSLSAWLKRRLRRVHLGAHRKIRPDSRLGRLPAEDQEKVFAYCEHATLQKGLTYLKENYQLELSPTCLGVWLKRRRADEAVQGRFEALRADRDRAMLVGNVFGAATVMDEASKVLLSQAVFEELRKEPEERDEAHLKAYMTLALKARSVSLTEERFRFDAARRAMECAAGLNAINGSGTDERTKIERAIKLLFGERPEVDVTDPKVNARLSGDESQTEEGQ